MVARAVYASVSGGTVTKLTTRGLTQVKMGIRCRVTVSANAWLEGTTEHSCNGLTCRLVWAGSDTPLRVRSADVGDATGRSRCIYAIAQQNYRWRACRYLRANPKPLRESTS